MKYSANCVHAPVFKFGNFSEWTDRGMAWEHTSLVGFRELQWWSLSACGTKLLCIPVARLKNPADTDGSRKNRLLIWIFRICWAWHRDPSLQINPNRPADRSNWLFGDVFRQNEAELLTHSWICLPFQSVPLLTCKNGKLTYFVVHTRHLFQFYLLGWRSKFVPISNKKETFPS